jgi:hypothetical protein
VGNSKDRESQTPARVKSRESSSNEDVQKVATDKSTAVFEPEVNEKHRIQQRSTKIYNLKPQPTHDENGYYLGPDLKPRLDKPPGWIPGDEEEIDDSY